jgi:hypothetical protein
VTRFYEFVFAEFDTVVPFEQFGGDGFGSRADVGGISA